MRDLDADDAERGLEWLRQHGFYCLLQGSPIIVQNPTHRGDLFRDMYDKAHDNQTLFLIDEYGKE